jgi:hypothetical protein
MGVVVEDGVDGGKRFGFTALLRAAPSERACGGQTHGCSL